MPPTYFFPPIQPDILQMPPEISAMPATLQPPSGHPRWYLGGSKPLVESDMRALFDSTLDFTAAIDIDHTLGPVYLGIDWGGGTNAFTVVWAWQLIEKEMPRFRVIYIHRLDESSTEKQADYAIKLIDAISPAKVVVDAGGGARQVEKLSNRFGELVCTATYISRPEEPFE
ncbi:MAG: hypothetical protein KGH88_09075, partial [Thaumarchaeota archaeon]|nr:hypothetical protein [Nitrososphaerota archaeon]